MLSTRSCPPATPIVSAEESGANAISVALCGSPPNLAHKSPLVAHQIDTMLSPASGSDGGRRRFYRLLLLPPLSTHCNEATNRPEGSARILIVPAGTANEPLNFLVIR